MIKKRSACPPTHWLGTALAHGLCLVSLALGAAPLAAQTYNTTYPLVIHKTAGAGTCYGTVIPQPGAMSLPSAITVATNLFNTSYVNCVKQNACPKPNSSVVTGAVTGYAHSFIENGAPGVEYVMTVAYACHAPPAPVDTVILKKEIIVPPGMAIPPGSFTIQVACGSSPVSSHVVMSPTHLQRTITVPSGSACTFTEAQPLPAPPTGCTWGKPMITGPMTQGGRGQLTVVVQNTLTCRSSGDSITVMKRVVGVQGVPTPAGPFQVAVACTPGGPNSTLTLTGPAQLRQVVRFARGSACTFTELQPLPALPSGCTWGTPVTTGRQSAKDGEIVEIRNTVQCVPSAHCQAANFVMQGGLCWMPVSSAMAIGWPAANAYCTTTAINGHAGWRLPTQLEAAALTASGVMNGHGWTLSWTWVSTSPGFADKHFTVDLASGFGATATAMDTTPKRVTCVR